MLNGDKTDIIVIGTQQQPNKLIDHFSVKLSDSDTFPSDIVRNPSVIFDNDRSCQQPIYLLGKSYFYHIHILRRIRLRLSNIICVGSGSLHYRVTISDAQKLEIASRRPSPIINDLTVYDCFIRVRLLNHKQQQFYLYLTQNIVFVIFGMFFVYVSFIQNSHIIYFFYLVRAIPTTLRTNIALMRTFMSTMSVGHLSVVELATS